MAVDVDRVPVDCLGVGTQLSQCSVQVQASQQVSAGLAWLSLLSTNQHILGSDPLYCTGQTRPGSGPASHQNININTIIIKIL